MVDPDLRRLWGRARPAVMGVVNVTPDSFSDGGLHPTPEAAAAHGLRLLAEGADILDIGGESTRPGADPVPAATEEQRVVPTIRAVLARQPGALVSVDTSKPSVAAAAIDAGAAIVNDVTAGGDEGMLELVAATGAGIVLMHMRGEPMTMQRNTVYDDVVAEVSAFLAERSAAAVAAGVDSDAVLVDPGIGFGKDLRGNLRLLAHLDRFAELGFPVVVGASRKSFIGLLTGGGPDDRREGSLAAVAGAAALRRSVVRVHDVAATVRFLDVLAAIRGAA